VQRVAGVVAVEDDLSACEAAPARDLKHFAHLLVWDLGKERPLHGQSFM
jgi:hypothetical protein